MKQPMFLISTQGKSKEQIKKEAREAFLKYQKVEARVLQKISHPNKPQVTPVTTPPVKTPRLSTEEFWKKYDKTEEHLGGVIQITNYPHNRKPPPVEGNSSETPVTTPPESELVKRIKKFSNPNWTIDNSRQGGAIQITNYPHTRKPKPSLSREELANRLYQELQARYTPTPTPPPPQKSMIVQFFRKNPKYPKKSLVANPATVSTVVPLIRAYPVVICY